MVHSGKSLRKNEWSKKEGKGLPWRKSKHSQAAFAYAITFLITETIH
jgi:hypothetical protein